jgi:hypothetical protein
MIGERDRSDVTAPREIRIGTGHPMHIIQERKLRQPSQFLLPMWGRLAKPAADWESACRL